MTGRTSELEDAVEVGGVGGVGVDEAGGLLQVGGHLILQLQLAHAPPRLQVVEVYQLVRLRHRLLVLFRGHTHPFTIDFFS